MRSSNASLKVWMGAQKISVAGLRVEPRSKENSGRWRRVA